jgi:hypothetical protein
LCAVVTAHGSRHRLASMLLKPFGRHRTRQAYPSGGAPDPADASNALEGSTKLAECVEHENEFDSYREVAP